MHHETLLYYVFSSSIPRHEELGKKDWEFEEANRKGWIICYHHSLNIQIPA